jgi:hypothetical protein
MNEWAERADKPFFSERTVATSPLRRISRSLSTKMRAAGLLMRASANISAMYVERDRRFVLRVTAK